MSSHHMLPSASLVIRCLNPHHSLDSNIVEGILMDIPSYWSKTSKAKRHDVEC